ncbi:hypothetical protein MRX96_012220 [Rhipicephalus microplus]
MGKICAYKINMGYDDEMTLEGYKWLTHMLCHPDEAQKVLLKDKHSQEFIETVYQSSRPLKDGCSYCFFYNKRIKYIWKTDLQRFVKLEGLEVDSCQDLLTMSAGLSGSDVDYQQALFGENSLSIEITPVYKLVINEVFSPFYMYQLFIVIVWMVQVYYQFAVCVVLLSIISVSVSVWQTRKQTRALKEAVHTESKVTVLRDETEVTLSSKELVPGDVVILSERHHIMECDAVLINGDCIVNESMLTGESCPITKVPVSSGEGYTSTANKRNTLFCGTSILHSRSPNGQVKAIVYRTGFNTMKGELVRNNIVPKTGTFQAVYRCVEINGYISHSRHTSNDLHWRYIQQTRCIRPRYRHYPQRRLKNKDIYCLNSSYINFCGALSVVCFDKTGTLTENSLDIVAIVPCENAMLQPAVNNLKVLPYGPMLVGLATCHSLHLVDGEVVGYEMDMKTLQTIDWKLEEPKLGEPVPFDKIPARIVMPRNVRLSSTSLGIVRQFPFESQLQRATVVVMAANSNIFHIYSKGAPEVIQQMCLPETVPESFEETLESYTKAWAPGDNLLTAVAVARDCNIIKENDAVIQVEAEVAQHGTIRAAYNYIKLPGLSEKIPISYKASADDIAVPLLSDCTYHLAADGRTFNLIRLHDKTLFKKVVHKGKVFARMLPEQKLQLIEALQELGHQVGMCGDGANDCGALKAAHAGISLSVAEASVASPFTAQRQNIQCMIDVVREGRATLAATFGAFCYMVCYCFVLLVGALFLFWDGQKPSEGAYVFIDVFISLIPPMIFGTTGPYPALTRRAPPKSISNVVSIFSILSFVIIQTGFHIVAYIFCIQQPWYEPFVFNRDFSSFLLVFPSGKASYQTKCTLWLLQRSLFSCHILSCTLQEFIRKYINFLEAPQYEFHAFLFVLSLLNFIFSYLWEVFLVQQFVFNFVMPRLHNWRGPRRIYEKLERDIMRDPSWPPVSTAGGSEDGPPSSSDHDSALLNLTASGKQTAKNEISVRRDS